MAEYASTAGCNQSPATKAITAFSVIEDFDPVLSRLETLVQRASEISDKLIGARPVGIDGKEMPPTQSHLIAQIQDRRQRLVRAVDNLESELARASGNL